MPCPLENCYQYNAVVSPITARDGAPPSNARRVEYQSFNSHLLNHFKTPRDSMVLLHKNINT